ncbi:hypothetical protein GBA52_013097 [Prunus armeniaca]|nr:hypothetical protein GBA52_013097 [Prunus armeniaca]
MAVKLMNIFVTLVAMIAIVAAANLDEDYNEDLEMQNHQFGFSWTLEPEHRSMIEKQLQLPN